MLIPKQFHTGKKFPKTLASGQTVAAGAGLKWHATSGELVVCVATDEAVDYTIDYAITTTAATEVMVTPARRSGIRYLVDLEDNSAVAQLGKLYELGSANTVDNGTASGTAEGFRIDELVGPAANKQAYGYFE